MFSSRWLSRLYAHLTPRHAISSTRLAAECRPSLETGGKRGFSFSACQWPSKDSIFLLSLALSLQRLRTRPDNNNNNNTNKISQIIFTLSLRIPLRHLSWWAYGGRKLHYT